MIFKYTGLNIKKEKMISLDDIYNIAQSLINEQISSELQKKIIIDGGCVHSSIIRGCCTNCGLVLENYEFQCTFEETVKNDQVIKSSNYSSIAPNLSTKISTKKGSKLAKINKYSDVKIPGMNQMMFFRKVIENLELSYGLNKEYCIKLMFFIESFFQRTLDDRIPVYRGDVAKGIITSIIYETIKKHKLCEHLELSSLTELVGIKSKHYVQGQKVCSGLQKKKILKPLFE